MTPDRDAGTPRWVKVFGVVAGVLLLLWITLHLTGRGLGGHTPYNEDRSHERPESSR